MNNNLLSILYITYNRSDLLAKAYSSLRDLISNIGISTEFIVSDDLSTDDHFNNICKLGVNKIVRTEVNSGLGANQNLGLSNCNGRYILQLQDDWIFTGEASHLKTAIEIFKVDKSVGIIQLTTVYSDMPFEIRTTKTGLLYKVFKTDRAPWQRHCSVRPYADTPHLKTRDFVNDMGPYLEGVRMSVTENNFKYRVANQGKWVVAQILHHNLFKHIGGEQSLNPGGTRNQFMVLVKKIPMGVYLEKIIRKTWKSIDHVLARMTSILLHNL